MTELLVNLLDGTVCDYRGCVVVETDTLNEEGKALLEEWHQGGNDGTASELGEKYGIEIEKYASDGLSYGNTIAFSGKALRDEITERLACGYDLDEYALAKDFTDDQFEELGQYIMSSDYLWNVYSEELTSGIRGYINDVVNANKPTNPQDIEDAWWWATK